MKMRVYKCDSCNKVITDPYTVNMRKFYLGFDADCLGLIGIAIPFFQRLACYCRKKEA